MFSHLTCVLMVSYKRVINMSPLTLFGYSGFFIYALPIFKTGFEVVYAIQLLSPLFTMCVGIYVIYIHIHTYYINHDVFSFFSN